MLGCLVLCALRSGLGLQMEWEGTFELTFLAQSSQRSPSDSLRREEDHYREI